MMTMMMIKILMRHKKLLMMRRRKIKKKFSCEWDKKVIIVMIICNSWDDFKSNVDNYVSEYKYLNINTFSPL